MKSHPLDSSNPDVGCRWLCMTAGRRTERDNCEIARAVKELPYNGKPLPPSLFPPVSEILSKVE